MVGPSQAIEAHCSGGPSAADNAAGSGIIDTAGSDGKPSGRLVDEEEGEGDDKWAVLFGNENRGVSRFVRRHADQSFWLPTVGFVESINVSVACGKYRLCCGSCLRGFRACAGSDDFRFAVRFRGPL